MNINEKTVIEFIRRNFSTSEFPNDKLAHFSELISDGKEIAAAQEYCKITGAEVSEAHLAVSVAKDLADF